MFGRRIVRGVGLALGSFAVCNFSHVNTALSLEGLSGALVNNEARISWIVWFIRLFPDFIQLWVLKKIWFFDKAFLEKIDRLSLSAKKRMEADNYSEYAQEREKNNFFLDGAFNNVFDNFYGNNEIWDSYGYLGLNCPEFPGEKMEFYGYDLFGIFFKNSHRGEKWGWLTIDAKGKPIILMPSGFADSDGESSEQKIPIDKDKIRERLPKIPNKVIDAQPDDLK